MLLAGCVDFGTESCDPTRFEERCDDNKRVVCKRGASKSTIGHDYVESESCGEAFCVASEGVATCALSKAPCDPSTYQETCDQGTPRLCEGLSASAAFERHGSCGDGSVCVVVGRRAVCGHDATPCTVDKRDKDGLITDKHHTDRCSGGAVITCAPVEGEGDKGVHIATGCGEGTRCQVDKHGFGYCGFDAETCAPDVWDSQASKTSHKNFAEPCVKDETGSSGYLTCEPVDGVTWGARRFMPCGEGEVCAAAEGFAGCVISATPCAPGSFTSACIDKADALVSKCDRLGESTAHFPTAWGDDAGLCGG